MDPHAIVPEDPVAARSTRPNRSTHHRPAPHGCDADHPMGADDLIDLVEAIGAETDGLGPMVFGFEPHPEGVDLHSAPLPHDERAIAAGLFTMRAEPGWTAVAAAFSGRARHPDSGQVVGLAEGAVVVDRRGGIASRLRVEDLPVEPLPDGGAVGGLTVDALHRMLGMPSPGEPPHPALLSLALWCELLLAHGTQGDTTTWADAVALHPGRPGRGRRDGAGARGDRYIGAAHHSAGTPVDASVETVTEATMRADEELDWARMHRRACAGHGAPDLSIAEVRWMDPTLYARWLLGSFPDPVLTAEVLRANDGERAAAGLLEVCDAVFAELGG